MLKSNPERETRIRRLFWDIEVSPNLVLTWQIGRKVSIGHDSIVKERKIICICYKWEHESVVRSLQWDRNQDDKDLLVKFLDVVNSADESVAHFGDGFDMPWMRTRCLIHGLEPLPLYKTIDTKAWAAKNFYFNSNKLDYLGSVLGYGHKMHTDYQLWLDVLDGKSSALEYMVRYCKKDVIQLEKVFKRLSKCVAVKTHAGVFAHKEKHTCAHCGSDHVVPFKRRVTASGTVQWQYKCSTCGGYYVISNSSHNKHIKHHG